MKAATKILTAKIPKLTNWLREKPDCKPRHLLGAFFVSFAEDFIAAIHVYALTHDWYMPAVFFGFLLPFANLYGILVLIEFRKPIDRLLITLAVALGVCAGTILTLMGCHG